MKRRRREIKNIGKKLVNPFWNIGEEDESDASDSDSSKNSRDSKISTNGRFLVKQKSRRRVYEESYTQYRLETVKVSMLLFQSWASGGWQSVLTVD